MLIFIILIQVFTEAKSYFIDNTCIVCTYLNNRPYFQNTVAEYSIIFSILLRLFEKTNAYPQLQSHGIVQLLCKTVTSLWEHRNLVSSFSACTSKT